MKTIQKTATLALFLFCVIVMTTDAYSALDIRLEAEKTQFKLGEPVVALVSLTNSGGEPVRLSPELGPEADFLQYFITDPTGKEVAFSPTFVADRDDFITLNNGATVRGTARIFYGGNGYSFPKAGTYKVVALYKESRSAPLELRVAEPANDAERDQARLILDHPEVGLFLMLEGGDELADAKKQIDALISKHPASTLTHYVRYAVAKNLSMPARNFVSKKPRAADLARSIEILQGLKDKDFQVYFQSKANSTLATSLWKLNRKDDARKVLQDFRRKVEGMEKLRPYYLKNIDSELDRMK